MGNLFENTTPITPDLDDEKDYYAELVGEGKKFKDEKALAKGKAKSDEHIALLERELAEKDAELAKRLTFEDLLTKIKEPPSTPVQPAMGERNSEVDESAIDEIISRKLTAYEKQSKAQKNVEEVVKTLKDTWGNSFPQRLKEKAAELEVSESFLQQVAETNPKAFIKLVAPERAPVSSGLTPPRSSVQLSSGDSPGPDYKPYSYFKQMLLSKDPAERARYKSAEVLREMHRLTDKYGADFLNK